MNRTGRIILLSILISTQSCKPTESDIEQTKEKEIIHSEFAYGESLVSFSGEKVGLISLIYDVPLETVKSVLSEYLTDASSWDSPENTSQRIEEVAKRNGLSSKLTSKIVFTFHYEVITKDEIIEEYIDDVETSR